MHFAPLLPLFSESPAGRLEDSEEFNLQLDLHLVEVPRMSEEAAPAEHPALQALDLQRLSCFVQVVHRRVCSLERERAQDLCACADF